jgi:tetratricopeptide (TPR) repeat protein
MHPFELCRKNSSKLQTHIIAQLYKSVLVRISRAHAVQDLLVESAQSDFKQIYLAALCLRSKIPFLREDLMLCGNNSQKRPGRHGSVGTGIFTPAILAAAGFPRSPGQQVLAGAVSPCGNIKQGECNMRLVKALLFIIVLNLVAFPASAAGDGPGSNISEQLHILIQSACRIADADLYRGFPHEGLKVIEAILPLGRRSEVRAVDRASLAIKNGELEHYRASLAGTGQSQAVKLLRAALAAAESGSDESTIATAADLLGLVLYAQAFENGDFDAPVPYLDRALEIRRRIKDRRGIAETLFHLGLISQNRRNATENDRRRAQQFYLEALPIAREGGFKIEQSYLERHIAAEEEIKGNLDAALAGFEHSLALRQQAGYVIYLAPALLALGDVHEARGEKEKSVARYQEALDTARKIGSARYLVQSHLGLAALAEKDGSRETATANGRSALEAARAAGYSDGVKEAKALLDRIGK